MEKTIYKLALRCKRIAEDKIGTDKTLIPYKNILFTDYTVKGAINEYRDAIRDLEIALSRVYPEISKNLRSHNDEFQDDKIVHLTAMESIVECVLSIEPRATNTKRIFVSHSSNDKSIVSEFNDRILQLGIGLRPEDIFCTSIEDMNIKNGEDIRNHIRNTILTSDFSFLLISENYKKSEICLNEMGAVWASNTNVRYYLLPNMGFDKIGWLCDTKQAEKLTDTIALDKLYKDLTEYYGIKSRIDTWSRQRETFVSSITKGRIEEPTNFNVTNLNTQKDVDEMILASLRSKPFQSLHELAESVGLSQRMVSYHLKHLQDMGFIECSNSLRNKKWNIRNSDN